MRKHKKNRWLVMAVVAVLAFSGCGAGTEGVELASAEEYMQAAKTTLEGKDSYTAVFEAVVSMNGAGNMTTKGKITFVEEPLFMQVDTNLLFEDGRQKYTLYLEKKGDAVNQYMNYGGEWTEMTLQAEDAMDSVQIYSAVQNLKALLAAAENCTLQTEGKQAVISAEIPAEKLYDVEEAGRFFQMAGMSSLSAVYFEGVGTTPVTFVLDKKTGEPLSYEIDLTKSLEKVTNNVLAELDGGNDISVKAYRLSYQLTKLGGVKAGGVPAEAKSSAINYEREISILEGEK